MKVRLLVCAVTSVALSSCAPAAPPAAPAADIAAVTREITQLETRWSGIAAAKDVAGFVAFYTDDAYVYLAGAPPMHGPAAIHAGLLPAMADPNFSLHFETVRVQASAGGDLACSQGTYTEGGTDPATHRAATTRGNYVTCWRRNAAGEWRAFVDITAVDPTAAAAPPPVAAVAAAAAR